MALPALAALPLLAKILGITTGAGAAVGAVRAATGTEMDTDTSKDDELGLERPRSAFGSAMDYLAQTSQPVQNLFAGRFGAAGRHLLDLIGKPLDAVLPGDAIPDFAKRSDFTSPSELVGAENLPGILKFPIDVAGDIITSPASLLSFGGAGAASRVAKGVEQASKLGQAGKRAAIEAIDDTSTALTAAEKAREIARAGGRKAREVLPTEIEAALSRTGRKALATTAGGEGSEAFAQRLVKESGGKLDQVLKRIAAEGDTFQQGGVRFAGKELIPEGAFGRAATKGVEALEQLSPRAAEIVRKTTAALGTAGQAVARATGNLKLPPGLATMFGRAKTQGGNVTRAGTEAVEGILKAMPAADRNFISSAFFNVGQDGGKWRVLTDQAADQAFMSVPDQVDLLMRRAASLQQQGMKVGLDEQQLRKTFEGLAELNRTQFDEAVRGGIMQKPQGIDTNLVAPPSYLQRIIQVGDDVADPDLEKFLAARPNFAKARKLRADEDLATWLNDKGASLKTDPLEIMARRAAQQGRAIGKAGVVKELIGDDAVLGPGTAGIVEGALKILAKDKDTAGLAKSLADKLASPGQRRGIEAVLGGFNRFWKPAVLYGLAVPRFAAITRNRIGAINQELAVAGANISTLPKIAADLRASIAEGINKGFGTKLGKDEMAKQLGAVDDAFRQAGGDVRLVEGFLRGSKQPGAQHLAEAVREGVLDGFIDTEELLKAWARTPGRQKFQDILDMPAAMFQTVEHRLRLGQFLSLRKQGVSAAEASRITRNAYLDYTTANLADRRMRDIVPFAAFLTRSIPQQAKLVAERGAIRQGAASLYDANKSDTVLPPWVEDQASVDLGMRDREGNPLVLAGLGLPLEVLDLLPSGASPADLGDAVRRNVVAQGQPLLKELYTQTTQRDPFFGSKPGSYARAPRLLSALGITEEEGEAGRQIQNARRIGLTAPVESVIGQSDIALDDRQSLLTRALRLATGARAVSVNEDRALQQRLQEVLERNPDVQSTEVLYQRGDNPETQRLLEALRSTKARIRANRVDGSP